MIIENGAGDGKKAKVDGNNQLKTFGTTTTSIQAASVGGNAYNINTGPIALTSTTASAVLYFKNDESPVSGESRFVVDSIAVGIDSAGTTSGIGEIKIIRNPTGGTIISSASAVDMNQNRNFGSSNTLDSLVYKGAEGSTATGGDDLALFYQSAGTRGFYAVDLVLEKGSSLAVTVDTQTTSGTTTLYVALIGHRVDGSNG